MLSGFKVDRRSKATAAWLCSLIQETNPSESLRVTCGKETRKREFLSDSGYFLERSQIGILQISLLEDSPPIVNKA